jgi:phosphatidylglycerol:prolipoprotein diacylglycerol transferase
VSVRRESRWLGRRLLISVGGLQVSSYVLMLYLGLAVGLIAGTAMAHADGLSERRFVVATIVLLVPALAGARIWYVLQHIRIYRSEPDRIWRRSDGGMALYGGLISVAVSIPVLALIGLPFWAFWDATAVTMLVGSIITRFGCLMNGCCAGRATNGPLSVRLPNHRGEWERRYPTPLLDVAWTIALLAPTLAMGHSLPFPGARFVAVIGAYAAGRMALQLTRESQQGLRGLAIDLACSAALLVVAAALLIFGLPR